MSRSVASGRPIHVEQLTGRSVADLEVEIVERKGIGHPDSLIDGAAEAVSRGLSQHYLEHYGAILHHNVDKGLLVGGRSNPTFGGGEIIEPIYVVVAGRATSFVVRNGSVEPVPVGGITITSIRDFLKETLRYLEPEKHVILDYKIKQGSSDLVSVFDRSNSIPLSNDTSIGVGYAPLTDTERIALDVEGYLNSRSFKKTVPEVGEDIKVMAFRRGRHIDVTIAAAFISQLVKDKDHYQNVAGDIKRRAEDLISKITPMDVVVRVNSGDSYSKDSFYLTVIGTSAEAGDDGNTGRGNRCNGLIAPMRQYSMEATCGKNPVNHTGKIFNVLAQLAAADIVTKVHGVKEVYVRILSRIGVPIDRPQIASAAVVLENGRTLSSVSSDIHGIIDDQLSRITEITPKILSRSVSLF